METTIRPDFEKDGGIIPVIIQDNETLEVLMLGYMNEEAWKKTNLEKKVCFYSRSKKRLWTKGEESGNFLYFIRSHIDCDQDTLLLFVKPIGNTCHTGFRSCFKTEYSSNFIFRLEQVIEDRFNQPAETSYVASLHQKGLAKIAQKVGEEAVETVIASLVEDEKHFIDESSDLLFHLIVLLKKKGHSLQRIAENLKTRHKE